MSVGGGGRGIKVERTAARGATLVRLTGPLDEQLDPVELTRGLSGNVIFDLAGVNRVTSFGVKAWFRAMTDLRADYVCFVRCRPAVVSQFNMVPGFGGSGQVLSLFAPFLCPACEEFVEEEIDLRKNWESVQQLELTAPPCPACGAITEFDDEPEMYFEHIRSSLEPAPPATVKTLLDEPEPATGRALRITKEIVGNVTGIWLTGDLDHRASFRRVADGLEGEVALIMAGVTGATPEGVDRFVRFIQEAEARIEILRVPPPLLLALAEHPAGRAIELRSAWMPFACGACGSPAWRELDGARSPEPPSREKCSTCFGALRPVVAGEVEKTLDTLAFQPASETVLAYVRSRYGLRGEDDGSVVTQVQLLATPPAEGSRFSRYLILKKLGSGGMAEVFLARQVEPAGFERLVALKCILPHLSEKPQFIRMFCEEARLSARLIHPNIVALIDCGSANGIFFAVMEHVSGWDLLRVLELCAQLEITMPVPVACEIATDVLSALEVAHEYLDESNALCPIIHRDVSPQNMLVSFRGVVKLGDFGVAKAADSLPTTETGQFKGKLPYVAPERVAEELGPVDCRSDLFSVGVVLYEC